MIEALPVIFTTLSVDAIPTIEPRSDHVDTHRAQYKLRQPFRKLTQHVLIVERRTKNIPVEPATFGCTPKVRNAGLQIDPPPRPKAPATNPPTKPIDTRLTSDLPSNPGSPSSQLTLYLILSFCSQELILTDRMVTITQSTTKAACTLQYPTVPHSTPISEWKFEEPSIKFIMITQKIMNQTNPCFINQQWPLSDYSIFFSYISSQSSSADCPSLNFLSPILI